MPSDSAPSFLEACRLLGIDESAEYESAREAYLELARATHPDVGGDLVMFQLVQQAWESFRASVERTDDRFGVDVGLDAGATPTAPSPPTRARAEPKTPAARVIRGLASTSQFDRPHREGVVFGCASVLALYAFLMIGLLVIGLLRVHLF